ncbi:MAG: TM1802 family CRISPR-associated protein, partial [candidate division WOR-3 bacterium]
MINTLARLGEIVKGSFLEDAVNKPNKGDIIKVNFNLQKGDLEFDVENACMKKARKYLLINLGRTGRQNQFLSTFTDEKRLLGEGGKKYKCWISLEDELPDQSELKNLVSRVIDVFYDKNGWVLKGEYAKRYEEFKNANNIEKPSFITVLIDGKPVSDFPEYRKVLEAALLKSEKTIEINGTCGICGKSGDEFFEASPKDFKFFITDKLGFSPNLSGKWEGSLVVCSDCRKNILKGESLVNKYFIGKVDKINYMLLPYFLKLPDINQDQIE